MINRQKYLIIKNRHRLILAFIFFMLLIVIAQIFYLNAIQTNDLLEWSRKRVERSITLNAKRGNIYDRSGELLATSILENELWVDPEEIISKNPNKKLHQLKDIVGYCGNFINAMKKYKEDERRLVRVKGNIFFGKNKSCDGPRNYSNLDNLQSSEIKKLNLRGVHLNPVYRRYYPFKEIFAQVVGYVNSHSAQDGIEYLLDSHLKGKPGTMWLLRDGNGEVVSAKNLELPKKDGLDITTNLDSRLQLYAYQSLAQAIKKTNAQKGSFILLDAQTGGVLAIANYPSFNPNQWSQDEVYRNHNYAMKEQLEFGSVIKPFTLAALFQNNQVDYDEKIDVSKGSIKIANEVFIDEIRKTNLSPIEIIKYSSNIGIIKMSLRLTPDQLFSSFVKMGLNSPVTSDLHLVKNRPQNLEALKKGSRVTQASVSHGYSFSLSSLKLAQLYLMLANGGIEKPLLFVSRSNTFIKPVTRIEKSVTNKIIVALSEVVQSGTGIKAQVIPYRSAGKTGTAKIIQSGVYLNSEYLSSFAGFAPLDKPRIVGVAVIYKPKKSYYGSEVAAPLFSKIVSYSLRMLGVKPNISKI